MNKIFFGKLNFCCKWEDVRNDEKIHILIISSELVRCYIDAKNIPKAREVSIQLLQLCQSKKLSVVSNFLQYLVRLRYREMHCSSTNDLDGK